MDILNIENQSNSSSKMIEIMKEIETNLNVVDYDKLWRNFEKTKYAIYNEKNFYINDNSGINLNLTKQDSFFIGKTDERFIGNTAILIDNQYIAIWNQDYISKDMDSKKLASLIIHEMFHCFQFSSDEKRFPNELLGIDYPITVENISLRMLEREYLLEACNETNKEKKIEMVSSYYNIRDKREKLIGVYIEYEKAIESVEGTAVYVEYKALNQLLGEQAGLILEQYTRDFTSISQDKLKIRQSTYTQGLLLGLVADGFIENWKHEFLNSEEFLSDFIKSKLEIKEVIINFENKDQLEIEKDINNWQKDINKVFEEFERSNNSNSLELDFKITGFDPMNVVKRNKEMIHKNFLRIKISEDEQIIKGPVKATIGETVFDVKRIEW